MYILYSFIYMFVLLVSSTVSLNVQTTNQQQQRQQQQKQEQHRSLDDGTATATVTTTETKIVHLSEMILSTNDDDDVTNIIQSIYTYNFLSKHNNSTITSYFVPTRVMVSPKSWSNLCGVSKPNETIIEINNYYVTFNKSNDDNDNNDDKVYINGSDKNVWLLLNSTYYHDNNNNSTYSKDCTIAEKVYNVQKLNNYMIEIFGATDSPQINMLIVLQQQQQQQQDQQQTEQKLQEQQQQREQIDLQQQLLLGSYSYIEIFLADIQTSTRINKRISSFENENQATTSTGTNTIGSPYFLSPESIYWSYDMGQVIDFNNDTTINYIDFIDYYYSIPTGSSSSPPPPPSFGNENINNNNNNNINDNKESSVTINFFPIFLICTILVIGYAMYYALVNKLIQQEQEQEPNRELPEHSRTTNTNTIGTTSSQQLHQQHHHHYNYTVPTTTTTSQPLSESDFALLPQMTYYVENNNINNTNTITSTDSIAGAEATTTATTTTTEAVAILPVVLPSPLQVKAPIHGPYNNYDDTTIVELSNFDDPVPTMTSPASQQLIELIDVDEFMDMLEQQKGRQQQQQQEEDVDYIVGKRTVLSSNNIVNMIDTTTISTNQLKEQVQQYVSPEAVTALVETVKTPPTTTTIQSDHNITTTNNNTCCSICLEEFCHNEIITTLPRCCHKFHTMCIKQWLLQQKSNHCPFCKSIVLIK